MRLYDIDYYVNGTPYKFQSIVSTNLFMYIKKNNITIVHKKVYTNEDIRSIVDIASLHKYTNEDFTHMKYRVYDYFENKYSLLLIDAVLSKHFLKQNYDRRLLLDY